MGEMCGRGGLGPLRASRRWSNHSEWFGIYASFIMYNPFLIFHYIEQAVLFILKSLLYLVCGMFSKPCQENHNSSLVQRDMLLHAFQKYELNA